MFQRTQKYQMRVFESVSKVTVNKKWHFLCKITNESKVLSMQGFHVESKTWIQAPETGKNVSVFIETMRDDVSRAKQKISFLTARRNIFIEKIEAKFRPSAFFFSVTRWNHCHYISNANHLQEIVTACFFFASFLHADVSPESQFLQWNG